MAFCLSMPYAAAQRKVSHHQKQTEEAFRKKRAHYLNALDSLTRKYETWTYNAADTLSNPYYFPLFASPTFYAAPVSRTLGSSTYYNPGNAALRTDSIASEVDNALLYVYATSPWLISHKEDTSTGNFDIADNEKKEVRPQVSLSAKTDDVIPDDALDDEWRVVVRKPNFWKIKANASLQLMQNYISDNWYKGGQSSYSWLVQMNIDATYNNKQKIIFANTLETKLGFLSQHNDEKHKFRTNSDLLRLTNKLGLRATKHWYYTIMLQSWTQFYRGFKSNDDHVYSDFMSPFESLFSIGMDYSLSLKKFNVTATISPIACDFKYVDRKYLAKSFGIDEGKHSNLGYGSNITIKYTWKIVNNLSWNGRIYYYTDYSKAQLEWENTFNFKFNKYLTTKLFLYPRFDDSVTRKEGDSYIQFNELLSFGLDVSF